MFLSIGKNAYYFIDRTAPPFMFGVARAVFDLPGH
jgi:hypothetical protein